MTRALITGAAGFIGGGLARRLLAQGWEVHALLGPTCVREALADIQDRVAIHDHDGTMEGMHSILASAKPDVVFHLASLFLSDHRPQDVQALVASNILLSTQLAEAMTATDATRLVNTGTSWQHFNSPGYRPVNLYAATKQAFEDILAYYHDALGLSCITLKLYDTYGPGDRRRKLINILLDAAVTGEPLAMSPGDQIIELTHLDDVTAAFQTAGERLLAARKPLWEDFLVCGTRLTVRELVGRMETIVGRPLQVTWGGRAYRAREVMEPVAAQGSILPLWHPRVDLDQALLLAFTGGPVKGR